MPKQSTINSTQKESIELDKFIFHLIIVDNERPTYLNEVSLTIMPLKITSTILD